MAQRIEMEWTAAVTDVGRRLDVVAASVLSDFSREQVKRWIAAGDIRVLSRVMRPADKIRSGDTLIINVQLDEPITEAEAQPVEFPVVYEDHALLVIDKPAGLVVHPGNGNMDGTLMNGLLYYLPQTRSLPRAGIVHRLDKDTTGLMVVAKTLAAYTSLVDQLKDKTVRRTYQALASGTIPYGGTVDAPIGRSPSDRTKMAVTSSGKPAVTHYTPLGYYGISESSARWTHVECRLETGRTHQIRVHMRKLGYPLVGDPVYGVRRVSGCPAVDGFSRQALHACALELSHPDNGEIMRWTSPLPSDMTQLLSALTQCG